MRSFKLVVIPALLALATADLPLDTLSDVIAPRSTESYRLPEEIDASHFTVEITPYFEAEDGKEAFTFDGIVDMTFTPTVDNLNVITIQENVREIVGVTLKDASGNIVLLNDTAPVQRVREVHFLRVFLRDGLTLTRGQSYTLRVVYIGNINETPLSRGIFRGSYKDDEGKVHWYAASHLQPTNSRQAFPCLDEPGYKSTFTIIVNRPAHFTQTYSNMQVALSFIEPGNRVKEVFFPTPRMSAYLVTIHISEEFKVIADNGDKLSSYRVIARPNAAGQGDYALEVGPNITQWLEEYFQIPYYTMGEFMKNDQIAVPDWASGATENWGLVSYRELRLLFEEGETNQADKNSIGTIIAHELAHKWFGNLITARWWDNVWVNEGFASYFEYFAMDAIDRSLELEEQFVIMYVQSALSADSSASTRALQHEVNSPAEVTGHFSGISYSKGATLLLMLKNLVSEDTFRKALNYFLVDRSYEHAFPSHLYQAFSRAAAEDGFSAVSIDSFMQTWVEQPGYPVLTVDVDMSTGVMDIRQDRFYVSASAAQTDEVWPLPLTYTTGSSANFDALTPSQVMTSRTTQITKEAAHEWVIFNLKQQNMYRVNYDAHNWEMIASALQRDHSVIDKLNRAQIVDDVFALMRSERLSYSLGFQVLEFLKQDSSFYVWYPAITGFSWLRNRFQHLPQALDDFDGIIHEFLNATVTSLGYDVVEGEASTTTLNRFYLLNFACNTNHQGCVDSAVQKYRAYMNGQAVDPNIRRHVFCHGIRQGGYEEWRFLKEKRLAGNNQASTVAMLRALGCTTNDQAIQEYLEMVLSDDVKAQDRVNAFTFLFMGDYHNARRALPFIQQNIDRIRAGVVLDSWFSSFLSNLAGYLDPEGLTQLEQWLSGSPIPEAPAGLALVTSARSSQQWGSTNAPIVLQGAQNPGAGAGSQDNAANLAVPTIMVLFTTLLALMLK